MKKYNNFTVRLEKTPYLRKQLKKYCDKYAISANETIQFALREYMHGRFEKGNDRYEVR